MCRMAGDGVGIVACCPGPGRGLRHQALGGGAQQGLRRRDGGGSGYYGRVVRQIKGPTWRGCKGIMLLAYTVWCRTGGGGVNSGDTRGRSVWEGHGSEACGGIQGICLTSSGIAGPRRQSRALGWVCGRRRVQTRHTAAVRCQVRATRVVSFMIGGYSDSFMLLVPRSIELNLVKNS